VSPTARRLHHFLDVSERYTGALLAVDDTVDLSAILNIWKESDVARYGRHVDTPVEHTSRSRLIIIADAPFSGLPYHPHGVCRLLGFAHVSCVF